jgi:hypothetical protein
MAEDLKEIKRKISEEWRQAFPDLSMYSPNKFYKIVGPIIIGLELIKLPWTDEYRPYFVVYSLWGNRTGSNISACLSSPIILRQYYNKKGLQFNIPYAKHTNYFNEVLEKIKQQTPLSFYGDISLKALFGVIDDYTKTSPLSAAPNSYLQAALQKSKLEIALYFGVEKAQNIFEQISKRKWDSNHFKAFGIDVNDWLKSLEKKVNNRNELISQITINQQDKKISKLKRSELII